MLLRRWKEGEVVIRDLNGRISSSSHSTLWIALAICLTLAATAIGAGLGASGEAPVPVLADDSGHSGWVEIDNRTQYKVRVYYQSGGEGHSQELGRVSKGHKKTFKIRDCGRELHFRASAKHSQHWEKELHVRCGKTVHWKIGGHGVGE